MGCSPSLMVARRPGPRSAQSRPHSDLHPKAWDPVAQAEILPSLSSSGLFISVSSCPFCYPACLCHPLIPSLSVCLLPVPISRTPPRRAVSTDLAIPFPGAVLTRVPRKSRFALNFFIPRSSTREKEMAVGAQRRSLD